MLFNSLSFLAFLAGLLLLQQLPLAWRGRRLQLLLASYVFYMAWSPPFVVLLLLSTLLDWGVARRLARARDPLRRRLLLGASLAGNLGLLGYFKYRAFALESTAELLAALGFAWQPPALDLVLPLGISFYTFQTLSYSLDVYRRRIEPWPSFLDYALYVSFFPQLVAGPIVRARHFLPQCLRPHRPTPWQLSWGVSLLSLGLFQKIVLADGFFAPVSDGFYALGAHTDAGSAWLGVLAFSGQVYCDFAGYSSCAVGIGLLLGFSLPQNFRSPYAAVGFADLWRRWHITLSSWLRDYLYLPLRGPLSAHAAIFLTMLLGGLWHGASWTFVAWGAVHGLLVAAEGLVVGRRVGAARVRSAWRHPAVRFLLGLATYAVWCATTVLFRAADLGQAARVLGDLAGLHAGGAALDVPRFDACAVALLSALLVAAQWWLRSRSLEALALRAPRWLHALLLAMLWLAIALSPGTDRAFIYFQF